MQSLPIGLDKRAASTLFGAEPARRAVVGTVVAALVLGTTLLVGYSFDLFSTQLRWFLLLLVLILGSSWAVVWVARGSFVFQPLEWEPKSPKGNLWQVEELVGLLARAEKGMTYSQLVVAQRVRDALLQKLRVTRGLSYEEVNALRRNPMALHSVLGDAELTTFVLEVDEGPDQLVARTIPRHGLLRMRGEEFLGRISHFMKKVEAWY